MPPESLDVLATASVACATYASPVELVELQAVVQRAALREHLDDRRRQVFQPHLSVGQAQGKAEMHRLVSELQVAWKPARFRVSAISLFWRGEPPDGVFRVAATVPLGQVMPR